MQKWALSLPERIQLLKLWVLPLLVYPTTVVLPSLAVVSSLATIYPIALNINSWGVTLDVLAHPPAKGGHDLTPPQTFLYLQQYTCFVNYVKQPLSLLSNVFPLFQAFAQDIGILVSLATFFKMGSNVIWASMPYLPARARGRILWSKMICNSKYPHFFLMMPHCGTQCCLGINKACRTLRHD